jgi:hypothetical protein
MTRFDEHERITKPNNGKPPTDNDHMLGQLMVESLNHRRRIEVLELRLYNAETALKDKAITASIPPGNRSLLHLAKQTLISVTVVLAALISALKQLGFLEPH